MSAPPRALNLEIFNLLKNYGGKPIPIAFVAQALGRRDKEIEEALKNLEDQEVVIIDQSTVSILQKISAKN